VKRKERFSVKTQPSVAELVWLLLLVIVTAILSALRLAGALSQ
jgi:hypothetical protein